MGGGGGGSVRRRPMNKVNELDTATLVHFLSPASRLREHALLLLTAVPASADIKGLLHNHTETNTATNTEIHRERKERVKQAACAKHHQRCCERHKNRQPTHIKRQQREGEGGRGEQLTLHVKGCARSADLRVERERKRKPRRKREKTERPRGAALAKGRGTTFRPHARVGSRLRRRPLPLPRCQPPLGS